MWNLSVFNLLQRFSSMALAGQSIRRRREAHFLSAGNPISLRPERETRLTVTAGLLWVTVEGDHFDHVLQSGDTIELPAGRHTVAEAMDTSGWIEVV